MSEWFKVQSWNDCVGEAPPRVRIPSSLFFYKLHAELTFNSKGENSMKKILTVGLAILMLQSNFTIASIFNSKDKNMTRTDICKENYKTLFKGEALPTTGDDPDMMAILQKYIFGEIFTVGELDIKTREMITVTSLAVQQTLPQLKAHINAALNVGVTAIELRESIYQLAPFIGFPKTLNALSVLNEVFKERGIETPLKSTATIKEEERYNKGFEIQNPLYGDEIKQVMKGLPDDMGADVARFLTEVCFGDFYTREGLDVKTRELLFIAALVTTGNTVTLKSHIKGNLKAGNSKETITASIIQCLPYVGFPNTLAALKSLKEVLAER